MYVDQKLFTRDAPGSAGHLKTLMKSFHNCAYFDFQLSPMLAVRLLLGYANEGVLGRTLPRRDFPLVLVVIVVILDGLLGKK